MNDTLKLEMPRQTQIEEFLATEFFPKHQGAIYITDLVDLVQLQFGVSDEARAIKMPCTERGMSGTTGEGSILECLTYFACMRLIEKYCVIRLENNTFRWKNGSSWIKEANRKEIGFAKVSLKLLKSINIEKDKAIEMLSTKWDYYTLMLAAKEIYP